MSVVELKAAPVGGSRTSNGQPQSSRGGTGQDAHRYLDQSALLLQTCAAPIHKVFRFIDVGVAGIPWIVQSAVDPRKASGQQGLLVQFRAICHRGEDGIVHKRRD